MTASAKESTLYAGLVTTPAVGDARDTDGRVVPRFIKHTVVSGETVSGTVKLTVHPANWRFLGLFVSSNSLSASAGVGQTPVIGDGTTANKYMLASDFDATASVGLINGASIGYTPTTNLIVTLTYGATGTPVVGQVITGYLLFVPGS